MFRRVVHWVVLAVAGLGCAPAVSVQVPSKPKESAVPVQCTRAAKLRDQALQYRAAGRALRARLFEEQAHALCDSLPTAVPVGEVQGARRRLEEVWSWIARTEPKQALEPNRLSDASVATVLDELVLGLTRNGKQSLIVEPVFADIRQAGAPMTGWVRTSDGGLGKVGEWFERYFIPKQDNVVREKPIGPFAGRVIVDVRKGYGNNDVAVIYDVAEARQIAQVTLPETSGTALGPLRLDDAHFALPVQYSDTACGKKADTPETCGGLREGVDIWQAWPVKRVARFGAPAKTDINRGERVVTAQLPNQGSGPPKKRPPQTPSYGGYAPTRITAERLRARDKQAGDETIRLQKVSDLGHGILAVDWGSRLSLVDWTSLTALGVFPHASSSFQGDAVSPNGRFVAYTAAHDAIGLFDRKTGSNRILMAPAYGTYTGHPVFSPDERWLATGGTYAFGFLWNTSTGRLERTLPSPVPFALIMEDEGMVQVEGFIRSGKEVVLSRMLGGGLSRYEVLSGRHLPFAPRSNACQDAFGPTRMKERSDGTVVFLDSKGKAYEMGPTGVTAVPECSQELNTIDAVAGNGEAFLQSHIRENTGGLPSSELRWISTRSGKTLGQWKGSGQEFFEISPDGRFAIGNAGPVIELSEFREIWPRRGVDRWGAVPSVTNTAIEFDTGAVLDILSGTLTFSTVPARPPAPVSRQRQDELQRIENQQRAETGEFAAECGHNKIALYKGGRLLASRSGDVSRLAIREDGSELLLVMQDGLHLWRPQSESDRLVQVEALSGYLATWVAFAPNGSLLVFGVRAPASAWDARNENFVLLGVEAPSGKVLFKKGQGANISKPELGVSGSRKVLRAVVGDDLVAWDVTSGIEAERWGQVASYAPLANGTLLAFLGPRQVELVRVSPPKRLATVQVLGNRPQALVTSPDGRFELLGGRQEAATHLRCRIGHSVLPFSACTESAEWEGLLRERLITANRTETTHQGSLLLTGR